MEHQERALGAYVDLGIDVSENSISRLNGG